MPALRSQRVLIGDCGHQGMGYIHGVSGISSKSLLGTTGENPQDIILTLIFMRQTSKTRVPRFSPENKLSCTQKFRSRIRIASRVAHGATAHYLVQTRPH